MKPKLRLSQMLAAAIVILLAIPLSAANNDLLKKDASHWNDYSANDSQYKEWWYFNLYDNEKDLQMFFTYNQNKFSRSVTANAFVGNEQVSVAEKYSLLESSASTEMCDITMDNRKTFAHAWAVSPTEYRILGFGYHSENGGYIWWGLNYELIGEPWDPEVYGTDPIHWLVYMPNAKVSGIVGINGKTYKVEGKGYHDHNWGSWKFEQYPWVWMQANDPKEEASMTLGGLLIDNKIVGGKTHFAHKDRQYDLIQSEQIAYTYSDNRNSNKYPTQMSITIMDRRTKTPYGISIKTDAKKTMEIPLPGIRVYEQVCDVQVGGINGKGWCEYTTPVR